MNFSGKHFEFAGTSSKDPLGDGSVSLIFAHIDTEMFKQPFGYPEYSSVYSGRLGRRGLTGTNRSESCLEIETEIVSEKGGIPAAKLRAVEQWLFSRESFAKLYVAEDEEEAADVQYINGEKKRLYLNCMMTEPEILTYAEGKVGWKVKIACDAPWAWQDEHTQTCYWGYLNGSTGASPVPAGNSNTHGWFTPALLDGSEPAQGTTYYTKSYSGGVHTFTTENTPDPTEDELYVFAAYDASDSQTYPHITVDSDVNDYIYPDKVTIATHSKGTYTCTLDESVTKASDTSIWYPAGEGGEETMQQNATFDFENGAKIGIDIAVKENVMWRAIVIDGTTVEETYDGAISKNFEPHGNIQIRQRSESKVLYDDDTEYTGHVVYVDHVNDQSVKLTNTTDDATRETAFMLPAGVHTIQIYDNGIATDAGNNNLLPYMVDRKFPRLVLSYASGYIGLRGQNVFALPGAISTESNPPVCSVDYIEFKFRNRRFLS